jgi:hypothetical protein
MPECLEVVGQVVNKSAQRSQALVNGRPVGRHVHAGTKHTNDILKMAGSLANRFILTWLMSISRFRGSRDIDHQEQDHK